MPRSGLEVAEHIADPPLGGDAQPRVNADVVVGSNKVAVLPRCGCDRDGPRRVFAQSGASDGLRAAIGAEEFAALEQVEFRQAGGNGVKFLTLGTARAPDARRGRGPANFG